MTAEGGPGKVVVVVPETVAAEVAGTEEAIIETATVIAPVTTAVTTTVIRVGATGRQPPAGGGHQHRHPG
jgi:hypothetical protein